MKKCIYLMSSLPDGNIYDESGSVLAGDQASSGLSVPYAG